MDAPPATLLYTRRRAEDVRRGVDSTVHARTHQSQSAARRPALHHRRRTHHAETQTTPACYLALRASGARPQRPDPPPRSRAPRTKPASHPPCPSSRPKHIGCGSHAPCLRRRTGLVLLHKSFRDPKGGEGKARRLHTHKVAGQGAKLALATPRPEMGDRHSECKARWVCARVSRPAAEHLPPNRPQKPPTTRVKSAVRTRLLLRATCAPRSRGELGPSWAEPRQSWARSRLCLDLG